MLWGDKIPTAHKGGRNRKLERWKAYEGTAISPTAPAPTAANTFSAHSVTEHSITYIASVFSPWQKCQGISRHILKALDETKSCVFKRSDE